MVKDKNNKNIMFLKETFQTFLSFKLINYLEFTLIEIVILKIKKKNISSNLKMCIFCLIKKINKIKTINF